MSRFTLEHPQYWDVRSDGYASPARLSLAFPEVRTYKLALAQELIELGIDGFFLDYRRQSNWSPEFGYVAPVIASYEGQHGTGVDPEAESWLRHRAAYQTLMLSELRALCRRSGRPLEIIAAPPIMTPTPANQLLEYFVDWPSWVALGLVDGLAPDGLPFDRQRPMESIVKNMNRVRDMIGGRARLYWSIRSAYDWGSGLRTLSRLTGQPLERTLADVLRTAWENGAAGVHCDSYDPGCEPQEWIDTLRQLTQTTLRNVHPQPVPSTGVEAVRSLYTPPVEVAAPAQPRPEALEDRVRPHRLTTGSANDTEARFSPDGRTIVFQSDRGGEGAHIWHVPIEGGTPTRLTDGNCNDLFPTFSPDGRSIAFCSDRADGRFYHLYVVPSQGGEPGALTAGPHTDTLPCFAANGRTIVFTSTRATDLYTSSNVLYEVTIDGGEPNTWGVFPYAQMQPSVTRDGSLVAFTALDALENENFYACVAPFGRPEERVRLTSPNESCYGASIAPDGSAVAYMSPGPGRRRGWDIWIRAVRSDALVRVTNSPGNDRSPSWSPDGRRLVFESNRDGSYQLFTINVSSLRFPATTTPDDIWGPAVARTAGMVENDTDPERTLVKWQEPLRPALDYRNRSFGMHLGRKQRVRAVTVTADAPQGKCRIDRAHTELYHGDRNGEFRRYEGPLDFSVDSKGNAVQITLGALDLTTRLLKLRFAYGDKAYTAVIPSITEAVVPDLPDAARESTQLRLWTTLQGKNRLLAWEPALGRWTANGHALTPTGMDASDRFSGEGGRTILPWHVAGDFRFSCDFLLPKGPTGAGGPIVYFRVSPDDSFYTFRYIDCWGTAVMHRKTPGTAWVQIGYATGHKLALNMWHRLELTTRGAVCRVSLNGKLVVESRDARLREGAVGVGCQVRETRFRNIRLVADGTTPLPDWAVPRDPEPYVVVCPDAGRGGYQAFPGLCQLRNGDLLAVFYAGWSHVSRPDEARPTGGAVAVSRSRDGGRSWSPAEIVLDTPLDDRDPAIWQCDDGTLVVSAVSVDWAAFKPPYLDWCYAYLARSSDGGNTWSGAEELRIGDRHDYTVWTEPRRLRNGEWLWPLYRNHANQLTTAFLRSADGGKSWGGLRLIDPESKSTDEPDVCQFPDDTLFCAMRPRSEPHMWQSRSTDNGLTWTRPTPLPFYGHCANLLHTSSGTTLLAHRDPGVTIHFSHDQAQSWAGAVMIDPAGGAYTQMVELPEGHVLIVYYTEGSRSQVRAQRLRVDEDGVSPAPWP